MEISSLKTLDANTPMENLSVSPWVNISPQCEDHYSRVDWRASELCGITKNKDMRKQRRSR